MNSTWVRSHLAAFLLGTVTLIVASFVAIAPARAEAASTTLQATVGPDPVITLTRGGEPVTTLEAGTYTIQVDDKSENHNFHLMGAGLDESTTVPEVTKKTWTVELKEGTYTFQCDPHAQNMKGSFTVTAAATSSNAGATSSGDSGAAANSGAAAQTGTAAGAPANDLPFTGLDTFGMALLGASLLGGGVALSFIARPGRRGA